MSQNDYASSTPSKKRQTKTPRRFDSSVVESVPAKKPIRIDNRQYKKAWEELPELRGWITPVPGHPQRACCVYCRISLRAHRRDLVDHSMTERHIRNASEATSAMNGINTSELLSTGDDDAKEDNSDFLRDNLFDFQPDQDAQLSDAGCSAAELLSDGPPLVDQKPGIAALTRAVRQSQQQILVVQTGGTIDKDYPKTIHGYGFEICDAATERIFERVGLELPVVFRTVCRKDSQELTVDDRFLICDCCANAPQQRILITHGTDTILETAGYLSEFADLASKIIVFTGAMKPETFKNSDADFNVGCALGAVQTLPTPGVYISMHGFVARWDQVERDRGIMNRIVKRAFSMAANQLSKFEHLKVGFPTANVAHVELNRPEKRNALNKKLWDEIGQCFKEMNAHSDCRVVVLSAAGNMFCAGIDLQDLMAMGSLIQDPDLDTARKAFRIRAIVREYQEAFSSLEKCQKPVIVAIQGGCIGGATSLIAGADVRYATSDSYYQIKEVELGLAADVGVLQRLTKVVNNQSLFREYVFTARQFSADEALNLGIVSRLFPNREELIAGALRLAETIASKTPVAVQGSKVQMNYARDHKVDDALEYMATWNMAMLQTEDIFKAATAVATKSKDPIEFSKL